MSGKIEIIKQWLMKGDHDLGTAKITYLHIYDAMMIAKKVREFVTRKMKVSIDYNDIIDK